MQFNFEPELITGEQFFLGSYTDGYVTTSSWKKLTLIPASVCIKEPKCI